MRPKWDLLRPLVGLLILFSLCGEHAVTVGGTVTRSVASRAVSGAIGSLGAFGGGKGDIDIIREMAGRSALGEDMAWNALGGYEGDALSPHPVHVAAARLSPVFDSGDGDHELTAALDALLQLHIESEDGWDWWDEKVAQAKRAYHNAKKSVASTYEDTVKTLSNVRGAISRGMQADLDTFKDAVREISENLPSGGRIIGALIYGFINGVFMGVGDVFRDALASAECEILVANVRLAFQELCRRIGIAVRGLFVSDARGGKSRRQCFLDAILAGWELIKAIGNLCWSCKALRNTILIMIGVITVAVVVTGLLIASVYGVLVKVAGVILNVVFGIQFLWRTVQKIRAAVVSCAVGTCSKEDMVTVVEGMAEIAGFVFQCVVLSGMGQIASVTGLKTVMRTGKLKALKFRWNPTFQKEWTALVKRLSMIKEGTKVRALNFVTRAKESAEYYKFAARETLAGTNRHRAPVDLAKLNSVDDMMRKSAAANSADEAAKLVDDAVKVSDDAAKVSDDAAKVSDDAAKVSDDAAKAGDDAANKAKAAETAAEFSKVARRIETRLLRKYRMASAKADDAKIPYENVRKRMDELVKRTMTNKPKTAEESAKISDEVLALKKQMQATHPDNVLASMEKSMAEHALKTTKNSMDELLTLVKKAAAEGNAKVNVRQLDEAFNFVEMQARATVKLSETTNKAIPTLLDMSTKNAELFGKLIQKSIAVKMGQPTAAISAEVTAAEKAVKASMATMQKTLDDMVAMSNKLDDLAKSVAHIDDPYVRQFIDAQRVQAAGGLWGSTSATAEGMLSSIKVMHQQTHTQGMLKHIDEVGDLLKTIVSKSKMMQGDKANQYSQIARELGSSKVSQILTISKKSAAVISGVTAVSSTQSSLAAIGSAIATSRFNIEIVLEKLLVPYTSLRKAGLMLPPGTRSDPLVATLTVECEGVESTVRTAALLRNDKDERFEVRLEDRITVGTDLLRRVRIFINLFARKVAVYSGDAVEEEGDDEVERETTDVLIGQFSARVDSGDGGGDDGSDEGTHNPGATEFDKSVRQPFPLVGELVRGSFASPMGGAQPEVTPAAVFMFNPEKTEDMARSQTVSTGLSYYDFSYLRLLWRDDPIPTGNRLKGSLGASSGPDPVTDSYRKFFVDDPREGPEARSEFELASERWTKLNRELQEASMAVVMLKARSVPTGYPPSDPPAAPVIRREGRSSALAVAMAKKASPPGGAGAWGSPLSGPRSPACPATIVPEDDPAACGKLRISGFQVDPAKMPGGKMPMEGLAAITEVTFACRAARAPGQGDEEGTAVRARTRSRADKAPGRLCQTAFTPMACSQPMRIESDGYIKDRTEIVLGGCVDADPRLGIQCTVIAPDGSSLGSFRTTSMLPVDDNGNKRISGYKTENVYYHQTKQWPTYMYLFGKVVGKVRAAFQCTSIACKVREEEAKKQSMVGGAPPAVPRPRVDFNELSEHAKADARGANGKVPSAPTWKTPKVTSETEAKFCPSILAHRGVATSNAVENTIDAIYEAALLGLDGIEIDVFLTGSRKVGFRTTILHDISLDRLLAYDQELTDWNYFELMRFETMTQRLKTCDLFPGLADVVAIARSLGLRVDVELKPESPLEVPFKGYNEYLATKVVEELTGGQESDAPLGDLIVSGFDFRKLKLIKEKSRGRVPTAMAHHGTVSTSLLNTIDDATSSSSGDAQMYSFDALFGFSDSQARESAISPMRARQIGKDLAGSSKARKLRKDLRDGKIVGVYTAYDVGQSPTDVSHSDAGIAAAIEAGVSFIETDDPLRLELAYERLGCRERVDRAALRRARAEIVGADPMDVEKAHAFRKARTAGFEMGPEAILNALNMDAMA